jgi:protein phosphatase
MDSSSDVEITARLFASELTEPVDEDIKPAPDVVTQVTLGVRTDLGRVRENNEDKFDFIAPEDPETLANNGSLYAVADGMGGHAAGQIAAEMALKALIKSYYSRVSPRAEDRLRRAIQEANSLVYDTARSIPDRSGMGTTLVIALIRENNLILAHVGDSRAYLIREGTITQITQDHSWVAEQVARGALTHEEALRSPFKNVITRSVGVQAEVEPDLSVHPLQESDLILLCSDGLTGQLSDQQIRELASQGSPSEAALKLVNSANESGGHDNITVLILRVDRIISAGESILAEPTQKPSENQSTSWLSKILKR